MSLLNDLKKVFFGAKAVAKSAADQASDAAKEAGDDLRERASDLTDKAQDALSHLKDKIWEETQHAVEKGRELKDQAETWLKDKTDDTPTPPPPPPASSASMGFSTPPAANEPLVTPTPPSATRQPIDFEADLEDHTPKEPSALAQAGDQILDRAAQAGAKAMDKAGELGDKLMDASEAIGSKIMDKARDLGGQILGHTDDLVARAQEEAAKENLQDAAAKAEALNRLAQERADRAVSDTKSSLLDGKDDFFAKADRFARGEYHDKTIQKDPDHQPKPKTGPAAGFDDHDGDGNELIDDAEVVD